MINAGPQASVITSVHCQDIAMQSSRPETGERGGHSHVQPVARERLTTNTLD